MELSYFSIETNIISNLKMRRVIEKHGGLGIAACISLWAYIYQMKDLKVKFRDCENISKLSQIPLEILMDIIQTEEYELFKCDDVSFWSISIINRVEKIKEKSVLGKNLAERRWNNPENVGRRITEIPVNPLQNINYQEVVSEFKKVFSNSEIPTEKILNPLIHNVSKEQIIQILQNIPSHIKNPSGFLIKALKEKWDFTKKEKPKKQNISQESQAEKQKLEKKRDTEDEEFQEKYNWFLSLSKQEQIEIQKKAEKMLEQQKVKKPFSKLSLECAIVEIAKTQLQNKTTIPSKRT